MNATKLNALKRDWLKFTKSVNNIAERNTTNARLIVIVCLRETRVRVFFDSFLPHDALNFSAKRGIGIAYRPSVRPSVRL